MRSTLNTAVGVWTLASAALFFAPGCRPHAVSPSDAGIVKPSDAGAGRWTLTREQLDAFIVYQRARTEIYRSLLRDFDRIAAHFDGGSSKQALEAVESKAHAEERALSAARLSDAEVKSIEALVGPIVEKRSLAKAFDPEGALAHWEKMKAQIPAEQRGDLDKSMDELRHRRDEATRLDAERQQYGNPAVDLVLSRQDELLKNQAAWLKVLTGRNP